MIVSESLQKASLRRSDPVSDLIGSEHENDHRVEIQVAGATEGLWEKARSSRRSGE